jgi:HAD superfamily hydrolase (TIGR01509 family)
MTETLSSRAYCAILFGCGKQPILNEWGCVQEIGTLGNMAKLKRKYGLWQPLWWLQFKHGWEYSEHIKREARVLPGVRELLRLIHFQRLPMAIASGSRLQTIKVVVKALDLSHYFRCLVSSRNLKLNKPFPDVYLETARRLGVPPEHCLVIEDSGIGVDAAKAAGMRVIAVPNRFTANDDFSRADLVLGSLESLTWKIISS